VSGDEKLVTTQQHSWSHLSICEQLPFIRHIKASEFMSGVFTDLFYVIE